MSKRKLNQQQQTRVKQQQAESRDQPGLVIVNYGRRVEVLLNDEQTTQECTVRANIEPLVAGDRVRVSETGAISALLARDNVLVRPDSRNRLKPVAANIDTVFIVIAPIPIAHANLIDRYLVAAALSKMQAVLVLNKTDLLNTQSTDLIAMLAAYEKRGLEVLRVSSHSGNGVDAFRAAFGNGTGVLVGQSGVGKSSLINALHAREVAAVGALSERGDELSSKSKGTHTTTAARLFHLPDSGALVDSPGIREFQLWHVDPGDVIAGFPDLGDLAEGCRFRDCTHTVEKDCEVQKARKNDSQIENRWQSYSRILSSL
ncbi:MAG: ribosome small subunit-dependent GTPase A [Pseudomonadales bacterium]